MNSTPQPSDEAPGEANPSNDDGTGYWMSERLDDGAERRWTDLGRDYSEAPGDRDRLTEAMAAIRWYRHGESMPFSPGMLLQEIIRASGIGAMAVAISALPVEFPEPDLLDRDRNELQPWEYQTCSTVAICYRYRRRVFVTHFLDLGLEAVPIAHDIREAAPLKDHSLACAAGLHGACRKHRTTDETGEACRCECGHAARQADTA
ncbi:hypothetical protein [Glycomyces arizonensis]|uniref:hypothetical protein n=1 Tax=Glycomyces arizonensis TaxID=256035 RepID=UPI000403739A|nr:hypothetical protein [Glycomyces arizonensis]